MSEGAFDSIEVISKDMDFSSFECGNADHNDFIRDAALDELKKGMSVTYVGMVDGRPVAFVTLVTAAYRTEFLKPDTSGIRKNGEVPAIKIARIATEKYCQRLGCGEALVHYAMAVGFMVQERVGCMLILTDALPDKITWYEHQGFVLAMKPVAGQNRKDYPMFAILSRR